MGFHEFGCQIFIALDAICKFLRLPFGFTELGCLCLRLSVVIRLDAFAQLLGFMAQFAGFCKRDLFLLVTRQGCRWSCYWPAWGRGADRIARRGRACWCLCHKHTTL